MRHGSGRNDLSHGIAARSPRVIEGKDGGEGWSLDGRTPPRRTCGIEAMAGFDRKDYRISGLLPPRSRQPAMGQQPI